jgi:NAD(P)-dependent dehydrogenase (short-subunit alcohol dehydrogenase family)
MSDLFSIRGKVALVTGGTSGIGFMIAQGLVRAGARVYVCSRKPEACADAQRQLSEHGECVAIPADLSSEAGALALAAELQQREARLHVLVNNAGATWGASIETFPESAWDRVMNLNLKGPFMLSRALLPLLEAAGSARDPARIINITSVAGQLTGSMQAWPYGPSKAALDHLTRILANELAARHITVNAIAPGVFPSRMTRHIMKDDAIAREQAAQVPLGRLGEPADMEGLAVFLASPASAYLTGNVINLDGGTAVKAVPFL